MKIILAGTGAFGERHIETLRRIEDVEIASVVGRRMEPTRRIAEKYGIGHATTDLGSALQLPGVEAAVLCTPTHLHARQAIQCMEAGKHVQVEIPLADKWEDARKVDAVQKATGLVCMVGHTRRFNPSHQWLHRRILGGDLSIQHLVAQTCFFRRQNSNARGEPRSWTDNLLWHHAAHTIDLFQYQTGEEITAVGAMQGPIHSDLGIAMDMSIQLRSVSGKICSMALSFNNNGPLGTVFRYICDKETYIAHYDNLVTDHGEKIDVSAAEISADGVELQDREFVAAIRGERVSRSGVEEVLPCYWLLHRIEALLGVENLALPASFSIPQ